MNEEKNQIATPKEKGELANNSIETAKKKRRQFRITEEESQERCMVASK